MVIFLHPERLWLLAAWGLLTLWAIRSRWRRRRNWTALAQRGRPPREGAVWWLATIACLILAIAQPKWGRMGPRPDPGHDVVLLIDVSRSMAAEDSVPNRMTVAVDYAEKLVRELAAGPDNRAAVVAFAGRGVRYCPLTENLGAVVELLHRLRPGCVQPGGTDLGAGLDAALETIGDEAHAEGQSIVVISDGEDLAERWKPRLDRLVDREAVVYAVTIGDAEQGHPVPSGSADGAAMVYRGRAVESRRSDAALRTIAEQTGGVVIALGLSSGEPGVLYRNQIEPSARRRGQVPRIADMAERFPLFLVAALSCLTAACWPPGRGWSWPWRMGWGWSWPWAGGWRPGSRRARALARIAPIVASAGLILAVGAAQPPGPAPERAEAKAPVPPPAPGRPPSARQAIATGQAAYEEGLKEEAQAASEAAPGTTIRSQRARALLEEALAAFEAAVQAAPTAAVPRYDSAAALFQLGRFEEARARYTEARDRADAALITKIDYALGNTALALGDVPAAIAAYDVCIASTARGVDLDAVRKDASINREFAYQQAQSPAIPQGQGPDDQSPSRRPDGRRSPDRKPGGEDGSADEDDGSGPSSGGAEANDESEKNGRDRGRRR